MEKLAVFDLDYTLTSSETQMEFILYLTGKNPALIPFLLKSAGGFLGYALKIYDAGRAKEINFSVLKGATEEDLTRLARDFYIKRLKKLFYTDGIKTVRKCYEEGYRVIISTASPEFYLKELESSRIIEKILGTRFLMENGRFTGKIEGKNHKGQEKVRRLKEYLGDREIDFENSLMFTDSMSDLPLLELMGKGYIINSRKEYEGYKGLTWR